MRVTLQPPFYQLCGKAIHLGHGGYIVRPKSNEWFELNETAADITYALSTSPLTDNELVSILHEVYDMPKDTLEQQVREFISEQSSLGNLQITYNRSEDPRNQQIVKEIQESKTREYPTRPFALDFWVNRSCNQKCMFCFASNLLNGAEPSLSESDWLSIVEDGISSGICALNVAGMEPLLNFGLTYKILKRAASEVIAGFLTNGCAGEGITKQRAIELRKLGLRTIGFSLESADPNVHETLMGVKDVYRKTLESIENLVEAGFSVSVQTVATTLNANEIFPLIEKLRLLGVRAFHLMNILPGLWCHQGGDFWELALHPKEYTEIVRKLDVCRQSMKDLSINFDSFPVQIKRSEGSRFWLVLRNESVCGGGLLSIHVVPNGDVYPCPLLIGRESFKLGNVKQASITELWHSPKIGVFRDRKRESMNNESCRTCKSFEYCQGGCLVTSEYFFGDMNSGDPRCPKVYQEYYG